MLYCADKTVAVAYCVSVKNPIVFILHAASSEKKIYILLTDELLASNVFKQYDFFLKQSFDIISPLYS